jgi:hypothetical protein
MAEAGPGVRPSTAELLRYFLNLGSLGFGGPVALVGYVQRDLVERRRWFTKEEYMKSLALAQLAPTPTWPRRSSIGSSNAAAISSSSPTAPGTPPLI